MYGIKTYGCAEPVAPEFMLSMFSLSLMCCLAPFSLTRNKAMLVMRVHFG